MKKTPGIWKDEKSRQKAIRVMSGLPHVVFYEWLNDCDSFIWDIYVDGPDPEFLQEILDRRSGRKGPDLGSVKNWIKSLMSAKGAEVLENDKSETKSRIGELSQATVGMGKENQQRADPSIGREP